MGNFIKANTDRQNGDAEDFAGLIRSIKTELDNLRQSVSHLDAMWDGPGSEAFKAAIQDDINGMEAVLENLGNIHSYETNAKTKYESCERKVGTIVAGINF